MGQGSPTWCGGALVALLALGTNACASAPFSGPEAGGRAWLEASSHHFKLMTSQSESEARDALNELEQTHAVFEQIAFPSTENPPGITEIVVLPSEEFDAIALARNLPQWVAGYFGWASYDGQPRFVVRDDLGPDALRAAGG